MYNNDDNEENNNNSLSQKRAFGHVKSVIDLMPGPLVARRSPAVVCLSSAVVVAYYAPLVAHWND
jgi:hypothetical protein